MSQSISTRLCYIDTSVIIKRISNEADSDDVQLQMQTARSAGFVFLSSQLAELELSRFLHRQVTATSNPPLDKSRKQVALAGIELVRLDSHTLKRAALFPFQNLGSLDSIHLSTAQIMRATHFLTRDRQLLRACQEIGITTTF